MSAGRYTEGRADGRWARTSDGGAGRRGRFTPADNPLQARDLARITLRQAFDLAVDLVEGEVYEIELEMDDKRPTYEIALVSLGRFMEIEVDAETGEVLEVEDETAIR